jgi:hypothetical protein
LPIDLLARKDLELAVQRVVLGKQDQVLTAPARTRDDQAIAAQERHSSPNLLSAVIVHVCILLHVDIQLLEIGSEKPQSALGRDAEAVKDRRPAGPRCELAPVKGNLGQSTFTQ